MNLRKDLMFKDPMFNIKYLFDLCTTTVLLYHGHQKRQHVGADIEHTLVFTSASLKSHILLRVSDWNTVPSIMRCTTDFAKWLFVHVRVWLNHHNLALSMPSVTLFSNKQANPNGYFLLSFLPTTCACIRCTMCSPCDILEECKYLARPWVWHLGSNKNTTK